jgi:hypothetical protein
LFFSLLMIPTAEACVLAAFRRPAAAALLSRATLRRAVAHPLSAPVLWIDAVVVPAGWVFLHHPLVGMAAAGVLQRRWMGTKMIVAAIGLGFTALRRAAPIPAASRGVLVLTAALMAAGVNSFQPVLLPAALPLRRSSGPWLWSENILRSAADRHRSELTSAADATVSSAAAELYDAAAGVLFVTALFLTMNGFLSLQPIEPWAGLAMTSASIAGTILAMAGMLAATRTATS